MDKVARMRRTLGAGLYLLLCALCIRQAAHSDGRIFVHGWFWRDLVLLAVWALGMAASFAVSRWTRRRWRGGDSATADLAHGRFCPSEWLRRAGLSASEWILLAALAVFALSAVAWIPNYYFISWPIATGFSWASRKAVQAWFILLSWAAVPLFTLWRPKRWLPALLAAGLVAAQILCCAALLWRTGFTAPYSDDHPSFLFRISEFLGSFPWRENYVPYWNAGVVNSVITSSGVAGYALLGLPFWLAMPPHEASPYGLLFTFVFFVPWMTYAGFRAAGLSKTGGLLGAIFALAQGPLFTLWMLRFGTVGASLAMAMLPSALAFLHAAAMRPRPSGRMLAGMVVSLFLMGQWPPMLMLAIPFGLLVLAHARRWLRSATWRPFLLAAVLVIAALLPTLVGAFLGKEVIGHVLQNPSGEAPSLGAVRRECLTTLMSVCADTNPLMLFAGLAGMWVMPWRRMRRWVVATFVFLAVLFALGPVIVPNLQLNRMGVVASCLLALPAACNLRWALASRARFAPFLQATILALLFCSLQNVPRYYAGRTPDPYVGTRRIVDDLASWIRANVPEDGRILFAGSAVHAYGRGHIAYLPIMTGREMMACDYYGFPRGMVEMNYPPRAFRAQPDGCYAFARQHGVTHVISFRNSHIACYRSEPEHFREVVTLVDRDEAANRDYVVFEVKDSGGRFAEGRGKVHADFNRISVDFGAEPPEMSVIRYNWSDRLKVSAPAALEPYDAGNGVVFIGIRPNGMSRVDIRYESRF